IVVIGLQKLCDACPDGLMLTFLAAVFAALALSMNVVAEHCRVAIRRCELLEVPLKRELAAGPNSERLCAGLIAGVFSGAVAPLPAARTLRRRRPPGRGRRLLLSHAGTLTVPAARRLQLRGGPRGSPRRGLPDSPADGVGVPRGRAAPARDARRELLLGVDV